MASFAPEDKRLYPRVCPRGLVSLAIYQGGRIPPAYGIVEDISVAGLRVASDRVLARGQRLQLRIQFARDPHLFESGAAVRWARPQSSSGLHTLTGIEFWPAGSTTSRLERLLTAEDFAVAGERGSPFEELLRELGPYLERLGDRLSPKTGA